MVAKYSIEKMVKLFKVSRSGYYRFLSRPEIKRSISNKEIIKKIILIHDESRKTYGSPRIYKALKQNDMHCGMNKVARLMKENGI